MRVSLTNMLANQRVQQRQDQSPASGPVPGPTPSAPVSPSASSNKSEDMAAVRSTALSALRNERFGSMLSRLADPGASESVALMRNDGATADNRTAVSRYAENSE